jgi:hypothetical protein
MKIDISELQRSEGRMLSVAEVMLLMYELSYAGWLTAIERNEHDEKIYVKIEKNLVSFV